MYIIVLNKEYISEHQRLKTREKYEHFAPGGIRWCWYSIPKVGIRFSLEANLLKNSLFCFCTLVFRNFFLNLFFQFFTNSMCIKCVSAYALQLCKLWTIKMSILNTNCFEFYLIIGLYFF